MAEVWTNFAASTLAANITSGAGTLDVVSGTAFPVPTGGNHFFIAVIEGATIEVMKITANSAGTFTISERGVGPTSPSAFTAGATVSHRVFAETLVALQSGGGGGVMGRTYKSASQYAGESHATAAATPVSTNLYATGFEIHASRAFDRIGVEVTTLQAGSTIRLGIYNDAGGLPTTLVVDAGTVDSSTTGAKEATIAQTLAGVYWLAYKAEGTAPVVRGYATTVTSRFMPIDTAGGATNQAWGKAAQSAGALASPFPSAPTLAASNVPRIWLRAT